MRSNERERRTTELGEEIRCAKCGEFWPIDPEFYFINKGEPHSWCKACYRADPKVVAKADRWKDKQRRGAPPEPVHIDRRIFGFLYGQRELVNPPSQENING
ncbi:MAG: hypothetical protein JWQ03_606 [Variovorax sp.]|nr:hypothetical protein [Variovorax sp.]